MGLIQIIIDPGMYYRRNTREDIIDYYELLLVYAENVLECSHGAKVVMAGISERFEIKNNNIAGPKLYLGGNV